MLHDLKRAVIPIVSCQIFRSPPQSSKMMYIKGLFLFVIISIIVVDAFMKASAFRLDPISIKWDIHNTHLVRFFSRNFLNM